MYFPATVTVIQQSSAEGLSRNMFLYRESQYMFLRRDWTGISESVTDHFTPTGALGKMNCQVAAELNNLGVQVLDSGDLRRALELFREALRYTMGDLHPMESAPPCNQVFPNFSDCSRSAKDSSSHTAESPYTRQMCDLAVSPPLGKPCEPFVHTQGINIIPSPNAYSPDVLVNTTILSSIILFNLAIVYHLKGLESKSQSGERLEKARSLYLKSHVLLGDAGVPLASTSNPVIDMLSMALLNNLAQVLHELSHYEESRQSFDQLIRFALTIVPTNYGDALIGSIIDQQKSNFLLNAIILHKPKLAAAA